MLVTESLTVAPVSQIIHFQDEPSKLHYLTSCELRVETTSRVSLPFLLNAGYSQRVEIPKKTHLMAALAKPVFSFHLSSTMGIMMCRTNSLLGLIIVFAMSVLPENKTQTFKLSQNSSGR